MKLVDFILRREGTKPLLISILQSAILEKEALMTMSSIFSILVKLLSRVYQDQAKRKRAGSPKLVSARSNETQLQTIEYWNVFLSTTVHHKKKQSSLVESSGTSSPVAPPSFSQLSESTSDVQKENRRDSGALEDDFVLLEKSAPKTQVFNLEDLDDQSMKSNELVYLDQEDICAQILNPKEGESQAQCRYLIALVLDLIRCLTSETLRVKSCVFQLLIDLLRRTNSLWRLHQLLHNRVIEDSFHIACMLLSLEPVYQPCYQIALDMLKRIGGEELILSAFLARGQVIAAVNLIQVPRQRPLKYNLHDILAVAAKDDDPTVLFFVYNFFVKLCTKPEDTKVLNKFKTKLNPVSGPPTTI